MKSFTVLQTLLSHRTPYNRPSWWTRLKNRWNGIRHLQLYHWSLSVVVDTLKDLRVSDIFLAQHGTVWVVIKTAVHTDQQYDALGNKYPDFKYIDIRSYKPTAYSAISGPAVIVHRPLAEGSIKPAAQ